MRPDRHLSGHFAGRGQEHAWAENREAPCRAASPARQIAALRDLKVEVYDAIPPTIAFLGPDAAQATYEQSYRGTFKDNPLPGRVFISEIWVRDGGAWRQKFYQETMMELE